MADEELRRRCLMQGPIPRFGAAERICSDETYIHPEKGEVCVCKYHWDRIEAGLDKIPKLRRHRDYDGVGLAPWLRQRRSHRRSWRRAIPVEGGWSRFR